MRKSRFLVIIAIVTVIIIAATGCGCAGSSGSSEGSGNQNSSSNSSQNTGSNNGQTSSGSSSNTANSNFEPTISLEQRKAVRAEDFVNGKNFDLTAYAEALGFTRLEDPKGAIVYAIKRDGVKCFFSFNGSIIAWFDYNDGHTYQTDPVACPVSPEDYIIQSEGQKDKAIARIGYERIIKALSHIATSDKIEMDNLPGFAAVFKIAGSPKYYPNGVIQETGKTIEETISPRENNI